VVKAQVLAGGRGKGHLTSGLQGGVQINPDPVKISDYTRQMIGYNLHTNQTPPEGLKVNKVMIVEAADIKKELYLAMLLDRAHQGVVVVASTEGGMDIEEVAEKSPEKVHTIPVKDARRGIQENEIMQVIKCLELDKEGPHMVQFAKAEIQKLYKLFVNKDCTQLEINPIAIVNNKDRPLVCIDAKCDFDDFSGFRQKELFAMEDKETRDPRELKAEEHDLAFVGMDGSVGCLVNGAGLAMSTMDLIHFCGGSPANFLDVGGGATEQQVEAAFKILKEDKQVKSIFVNIFGGIMRCNIVAEGMINAAKKLNLDLPLVVRLVGTNADMAAEMVKEARDKMGIKIYAENDFQKAAELAVKLAN